jgi:hypothetical protein
VFYEYLNFIFQQWRYEGVLPRYVVLVAFASFDTVIPIVVEFYWLLIGPAVDFTLPEPFSQSVHCWLLRRGPPVCSCCCSRSVAHRSLSIRARGLLLHSTIALGREGER